MTNTRTITFDDSIYKLVPLEPTVEQLRAMQQQFSKLYGWGLDELRAAHDSLIAAAPEYQDTCTDGGMCGIGGYCKDCIQDTKKDE